MKPCANQISEAAAAAASRLIFILATAFRLNLKFIGRFHLILFRRRQLLTLERDGDGGGSAE